MLIALALAAALVWHPVVTTAPWQIQLQGRVDVGVPAQVFEVDASTSSVSVAALHRRGARVLCYVDAGSWESFRPDAGAYPRAVLGKTYAGYPDERWLDVRRWGILRPILLARVAGCARAGFDGIDFDNVDGYQNDTGFALTADEQLRFDRHLAAIAHAAGRAVVLKNDGDQVGRLVGAFDGAVVESCLAQRACASYEPFVRAGKPVWAVEYHNPGPRGCAEARRLGFSLIVKSVALRAPRHTCPR